MISNGNHSYNKKRILITGGAGFIGGSLIRRLLKETNYKIYNLDKIGYASDLNTINNEIIKLGKKGKERYELLNINLNNFEAIKNAFEHCNPDMVMHLAAETHVDRSITGSKEFIESNIMGTYNLLEVSRLYYERLDDNRQKAFRFHHISTDEVFGSLDNIGSFNELSRYDPRSPYSASKASSDHLVNAWWHTYKLPTLITNCSNNYGPYQYPEKLIPLAIINAVQGKKIPLYGDGLNVRDWLYIDDHIDALLLTITKGKPGQSFCIGGYGEKKNKDVLIQICRILDEIKPSDKTYLNQIEMVKDREGHDFRYSINPTKITNELGWKPRVGFNEGLLKTIKWYLSNLDWCLNINSSN